VDRSSSTDGRLEGAGDEVLVTWVPLATSQAEMTFSMLCEHLVCAHTQAAAGYDYDPWIAHQMMHLEEGCGHAHDDVTCAELGL
jgi:hypothetical protein